MFNDQNMDIGTYNLILRLITPKHIKSNNEIARLINNTSEHENEYVIGLINRSL